MVKMKNRNEKPSIFHEVFASLVSDYSKNKKIIKDNRLGQIERKILTAYILLRDKKNNEAVKVCESAVVSNPYFKSHLNLVKGIALNNTSRFNDALKCLELCIDHFQRKEDEIFRFQTHYNLLLCYSNQQLNDKLADQYDVIRKFKFEDTKVKTRQNLLLLSYHIDTSSFNQAYGIVDDISLNIKEVPDADLPNFYIDCFNLGLRNKDNALVEKALFKLKAIRKFHLSENYKYMNSLYNFYSQDKPIYLRDEDLKKVPFLNNQAQCIKALSQGDLDQARGYWGELHQAQSHCYLDNFEYNGAVCIFSLCLEKCLDKIAINIKISDSIKSKKEKLIYFTNHFQGVITKEDLFKLIFEKECMDKDDIQKITKLISYYKKDLSASIKSVHGAYEISRKSEKAA